MAKYLCVNLKLSNGQQQMLEARIYLVVVLLCCFCFSVALTRWPHPDYLPVAWSTGNVPGAQLNVTVRFGWNSTASVLMVSMNAAVSNATLGWVGLGLRQLIGEYYGTMGPADFQQFFFSTLGRPCAIQSYLTAAEDFFPNAGLRPGRVSQLLVFSQERSASGGFAAQMAMGPMAFVQSEVDAATSIVGMEFLVAVASDAAVVPGANGTCGDVGKHDLFTIRTNASLSITPATSIALPRDAVSGCLFGVDAVGVNAGCSACLAGWAGRLCDTPCQCPVASACNANVSGDGTCTACLPRQAGPLCQLTCPLVCPGTQVCSDGPKGSGNCVDVGSTTTAPPTTVSSTNSTGQLCVRVVLGVSLEAFNQSAFVATIAAALGLQETDIAVLSITPASVVVVWSLPSLDLATRNTKYATFFSLVSSNSSAVSTLGILAASVTSLIPTMAPPTTAVTAPSTLLPSPAPTDPPSDHSYSAGAIAGIAVGVAVVVLLSGGFACWLRQGQRGRPQQLNDQEEEKELHRDDSGEGDPQARYAFGSRPPSATNGDGASRRLKLNGVDGDAAAGGGTAGKGPNGDDGDDDVARALAANRRELFGEDEPPLERPVPNPAPLRSRSQSSSSVNVVAGGLAAGGVFGAAAGDAPSVRASVNSTDAVFSSSAAGRTGDVAAHPTGPPAPPSLTPAEDAALLAAVLRSMVDREREVARSPASWQSDDDHRASSHASQSGPAPAVMIHAIPSDRTNTVPPQPAQGHINGLAASTAAAAGSLSNGAQPLQPAVGVSGPPPRPPSAHTPRPAPPAESTVAVGDRPSSAQRVGKKHCKYCGKVFDDAPEMCEAEQRPHRILKEERRLEKRAKKEAKKRVAETIAEMDEEEDDIAEDY